MSVVVIDDFHLLEDYVQAWEDLAANALEPNPFYEPWMLMPALRWFTTERDVRVVLVAGEEQDRAVLHGVFPLERKTKYKKLPVSSYSMWQHLYCALCTPLIRASHARECLESFLDWLSSERESALIEFNQVSGDGSFHQVLSDCLAERGRVSLDCETYRRAMFRPMESADKYLRAAISPKHLKDMRRRLRRLSEIGQVECDELESDGDVDSWIDEFLQLEASGWKGKDGGAFASREASRNYFVAVAREGFKRGKLMMSAFRLNGRPLAQKFSIVGQAEAFALKIAFDEHYSYFSPGILLEVENIRWLHSRPDVEWMDSCAAPVHFINRLWLDRRTIRTILVSNGKRGDFILYVLPLLTQANRRLRGFLRGNAGQQEDENGLHENS